MREKGSRNLNYEDRKRIEAMAMRGTRVVEIAESIGAHRATIYKQLKCSGTPYRADEAQKTIYGR